jgi:hypothetical protein
MAACNRCAEPLCQPSDGYELAGDVRGPDRELICRDCFGQPAEHDGESWQLMYDAMGVSDVGHE